MLTAIFATLKVLTDDKHNWGHLILKLNTITLEIQILLLSITAKPTHLTRKKNICKRYFFFVTNHTIILMS